MKRIYEPYPGAFDHILGPEKESDEPCSCPRCEGEGWLTYGRATRDGKTEDIAYPCPDCDGEGVIWRATEAAHATE